MLVVPVNGNGGCGLSRAGHIALRMRKKFPNASMTDGVLTGMALTW